MTAAHKRLAMVTGADSGMGKATAELLATEGFDVGITFHTDESGAQDTRAGIECWSTTAAQATATGPST